MTSEQTPTFEGQPQPSNQEAPVGRFDLPPNYEIPPFGIEVSSATDSLDGPYHLVTFKRNPPPVSTSHVAFISRSDLIDSLKALIAESTDKEVYAWMFRGEELFISKGNPRYLLVPNCEPIPLFNTGCIEPDKSGCIGFEVVESDQSVE